MAKPLQLNEEGRVTDPETQKNQKGYELYEKEQSDAQRKLEERDKRMLEGARKIKEKIKSVLHFKKGGKVNAPKMKHEYSAPSKSSASARADGCAIRGKTRA